MTLRLGSIAPGKLLAFMLAIKGVWYIDTYVDVRARVRVPPPPPLAERRTIVRFAYRHKLTRGDFYML